jgi:hypothetical protein
MVEKLATMVSRMAEQTIELLDVNIAKHDPQSWDILRQQFLCYRHSLAVAHRMLSAIVDSQKIQSLDPIGTFNLIHLSHALNSMNLLFVDSEMEAILAMTSITQGQQNHFLSMHAGEVADLQAQLQAKDAAIAEAEVKIADAYSQVDSQNLVIIKQSEEMISVKTQLVQQSEKMIIVQTQLDLILREIRSQKVRTRSAFIHTCSDHYSAQQPGVAVAALSFVHDDGEPAAKKGRRSSEEQATL